LALKALRESGIAATDPAFKRGIQYLLNTQAEDGAWFVPMRASRTIRISLSRQRRQTGR